MAKKPRDTPTRSRRVTDNFAECPRLDAAQAERAAGAHSHDELDPYLRDGCVCSAAYRDDTRLAIEFVIPSKQRTEHNTVWVDFLAPDDIAASCSCPRG